MAEAIEGTIPCDHCNNQISLQDWSQHSRQCIHGEKNRNTKRQRDSVDESDTDQIPCEYCNTQISLNDWHTHTQQCADAHKRQIEKLKSGIVDGTEMEFIPCEYCDEPINIHDWELHSRKCASNDKRGASNANNSNKNGSMDTVIPCEYCGDQVSIHDLTWHTKQCADAENQRLQKRARQVANDRNDAVIPCEYCDQSIALELYEVHQAECRRKQNSSVNGSNVSHEQIFGGIFPFPQHWSQSSLENLSRYILEPDTDEYRFVVDNFRKTLPSNQIVQIERIQNRRWYRQYDAHRDSFIEKYSKSTELWLFHGCKSQSIDAIINDCFNRSHALRCAVGQGIYFATAANISLGYTHPDANKHRHMFMARVLVGKTTGGSPTTRVCPPGFDTTGGGNVFVTYHDAQAYGEYLITFI